MQRLLDIVSTAIALHAGLGLHAAMFRSRRTTGRQRGRGRKDKDEDSQDDSHDANCTSTTRLLHDARLTRRERRQFRFIPATSAITLWRIIAS
jgi:hypothetical protein